MKLRLMAAALMLPTFIVGQSINEGALEVVLEDYEEDDFNFYAVYQHTRHLSTKIRTFMNHLHEAFSE